MSSKKTKQPPNIKLENLPTYAFGDFVVYMKSPTEHMLGRVTKALLDEDGIPYAYSVCYTHGCTAAVTPARYLRRATLSEEHRADPDIGFHRFHEECPNVNPEICGECRLLMFNSMTS